MKRIATPVCRTVDVLHHVERRQYTDETTSVHACSVILRRQIEVTGHEWTTSVSRTVASSSKNSDDGRSDDDGGR